MLPFPKRPQAPQEYELGTGDYVAYERAQAQTPQRMQRMRNAEQTPRAAFARTVQPAPSYGFPQEFTPYSTVQVAPHVHNDMRMMSHAPPPHSLSPVAMPQAAQTSSHRAQDTVILRGRPDLRWGVGLALAGALLGGVFGVAMHNSKRDAASAPAAQIAEPAAPQAVVPPQFPAPAPLPAAPAVVVAPQAAAVAQPAVAQPAVAQPAVAQPAVAQPALITQPPGPAQPAVASTSLLPPPGPPAAPPTAYAAGATPPAPPASHASQAARGGHAAHAAPTARHAKASPAPKAQATAPRGGQRLDLATKVSTPGDKAEKGTFVDALRLKSDAQKDLSNTLGGSN